MKKPIINNQIKAKECILINENGEKLDKFSIDDARRLAREKNLDLVVVIDDKYLPTCRLMNYSKYKYQQEKKQKINKKNNKVKIKEIKFRLNIDTHDYNTKMKHISKFLSKGYKVRTTIMFRGREKERPEAGISLLDKLCNDLKEYGTCTTKPKLEGNNMFILLNPTSDDSQ